MRSDGAALQLQPVRSRSGWARLGLLPLALAGLVGVASLAESDVVGGPQLAVRFGLLFAVTIAYAKYALSRNPIPSQLPFVWAAMLLTEFVVSPLLDIAAGTFVRESYGDATALSSAVAACALFVLGLWVGTAFFDRINRTRSRGTAELSRVVLEIPLRALVALVGFAAVALAAELWVLRASGVFGGDLVDARGAGLIGTTIAAPLVRLADVGTLLGSWYAEVGHSGRARRRSLWVALGCAAVAAVMPIMLQQRFGLLQTAMYFIMPKLLAGRRYGRISQSAVMAVLPFLLAAAVLINSVTGTYRQIRMSGGAAAVSDAFAVAVNGGVGESHFRHLWLLSQLIQRGIDEPGFGGLYYDVPFLGDMLIILPRAIFPGKPVTTMEVVNGVMFGRQFGALDRGSASVHTASVWNQFYILGGAIGILPLAALFAMLALGMWRYAMGRAQQPAFLVVAVMVWIQLGWLSFNVALTTVELPGMALAFWLTRRTQPRVAVQRGASGRP